MSRCHSQGLQLLNIAQVVGPSSTILPGVASFAFRDTLEPLAPERAAFQRQESFRPPPTYRYVANEPTAFGDTSVWGGAMLNRSDGPHVELYQQASRDALGDAPAGPTSEWEHEMQRLTTVWQRGEDRSIVRAPSRVPARLVATPPLRPATWDCEGPRVHVGVGVESFGDPTSTSKHLPSNIQPEEPAIPPGLQGFLSTFRSMGEADRKALLVLLLEEQTSTSDGHVDPVRPFQRKVFSFFHHTSQGQIVRDDTGPGCEQDPPSSSSAQPPIPSSPCPPLADVGDTFSHRDFVS